MASRIKSYVAGGRAGGLMLVIIGVAIGWSSSRQDESTAVAQLSPAFAARSHRTAANPVSTGAALAGSGLISHFHEDPGGGPTRVILVDPQLKRMVVYHVPIESGAIQLKSVRNFTVDFQVQAYNSDDPSTIDMEKTLQRN